MANDYGVAPGWRVDGYQMDRNGAVTLEVVKPWEPLLTADGEGLSLPQIPRPPAITNYKLVSGGWKRSEAGGMEISFEYEGVQPPDGGGGGEYTNGEIGATWSMRGSLYQKDVRTTPRWTQVREDYVWNDAEKEFPDFLPDDSKVKTIWVATSKGNKKLNPMRGVSSVDDYSAVLTKTYLSRSLPIGIFLRINQTVRQPYSELPTWVTRDWKYMAPEWDEHGDLFRISEHMELSGPGGWNKDLYEEMPK